MAVDVSSFTDTDIINGTLSHTVTITPATEISSVTYSVENSTLSNEVSVDAVGYTAEDTESGTEVTLKPHILRHNPTSTGSADIVMTITDIYGRHVNVTNSVTIMTMNNVNATSSIYFMASPMANTVDSLNPSECQPVVANAITPRGVVNGVANTNILSYFKGPVVGTTHNIIRAEFVNDGEFVVSTTQPSQRVPNMVDTGNIYTATMTLESTSVNVPIAKLSNYIPASWDEASIFDNMVSTSTFQFKPNDTYLKLYTYNDGWDDRDYIRYINGGTTKPISVQANTTVNIYPTETGLGTTGLIGTLIDWTSTGNLLIPRFANKKFNINTLSYPEATYGVKYSSSSSNDSDKSPTSAIYMYATDLSSIVTSGVSLNKALKWILAINSDLINSGITTSNTLGTLIDGTGNLNFS